MARFYEYNLDMDKFTYTFHCKEILGGWIRYLVNDDDPSDILVLRKTVLSLCPLPKWTKTYQKKVKKHISGLSNNYNEGIFRMDQRLYLLHDGDKVNYEVKDPYNCKHNDCYIQKIEGVIEWLNDIMTHPALNSRFPFMSNLSAEEDLTAPTFTKERVIAIHQELVSMGMNLDNRNFAEQLDLSILWG